ncbi:MULTISPECIES: YadA-like family protein [unclassified Acinetobacter]|uniref:YadA-like family protein n=1 Tax=unclassified Acinetobacter TaxID=196816 RepID=UPI0015D1E742|nr:MULTISPECIES: YadA-like family protein [unclassified Acinetobacter]UUS64375.1 YadA-like family protein [Acinetobacter sp. YH12068_T]
MKFQKTLLAASLAFLAVGANAKNANPTQQSEGLFNSTGYVFSPVLNQGTNWADLGTGAVTSVTGNGSQVTYEIFNYKTASGKEVVSVTKLGSKTSEGFFEFVKDAAGNDQLVEYKGNDVLLDTLSNGGQLMDSTAGTTTTGYELKEINNEHLVYGYQGNVGGLNQQLQGAYINPEGVTTQFTGTLIVPGTSNSKYVNSGIIGNTGAYDDVTGQPLDVSKNIYGVSAKDGNNFVALTGNGIALANLSAGALQYDGSVITNESLVGNETSAVQKTRQYTVNGQTILEVYNDDAGNEVASKFYIATANGAGNYDLTATTSVTSATVAGLLPDRSGTATYKTGEYTQSVIHNTVTNQNVTYSEAVTTIDKTKLQAGIVETTNLTSATATADESVGNAEVVTKQSVATGVIGKNADGSNKYGTEVVKTDANGTQKTEITASGINTTGVINAADYQIGGVSIVDGIKTSVDTAVAGATEAIDAKVAEVDSKIVEVDARLTQFNTTAANLNSRVDQLNSRVNEVEEKAYRGVAIALAAQQQIPNIGAGQFAVFGGVGHYEGESAGALGVASVFADGRTSLSAAIGVAGGSEVGGRVGLSYVFGGK